MSTKLQITITSEEEELLAQRAATFGYGVTKYAKYLIAREASKQLKEKLRIEKMVRKALKDHLEGKTKVMSSMEDVDEFLDSIA